MKKRKYSFGLVLTLIYLALSCALLISFTTAKYADVRTLFTDFRAAQFNVAILLGDKTQDESEDESETTQILTLTDLRPGMTGETAVRVPFLISNGPDDKTTAKVGIKYTIQVRSANYLPLKFTLEEIVQPGTEQQQTRTYRAQTPLVIQPEADSQDHVWYQYAFQPPAEPEVVELNGNPAESAQLEFELIPETLGTYVENQHVLVVEWPEDTGSDIQYRKEVDPIHILVTAHSVNRLGEEGYEIKNPTGGDTHTAGILFLKDGIVNTFYDVDLRAFLADAGETERTFDFWVDNGLGQGGTQSKDRIDYGIDMLLPLKKVGNPGTWQELDLDFRLDGKNVFHLDQNLCVLYNEKTEQFDLNANGTMKKYTISEINEMEQRGELRPEQVPYGFYIGGNAELLNYAIDETAAKVKIHNRRLHTLALFGSGTDIDKILNPTDLFSFHYKMKLLITAEFKDELPAATEPDGDGNEEGGPTETTSPQPPSPDTQP